MSASLGPHGLQYSGLPCPSPSPGVCSDSYPLSWWCHPTISSSVAPLFSCPQLSFPASGSFPMISLFASGVWSIEASAWASVPPINIQGWFPLGLTGLISLLSRDSQESSPEPQFKSISSLALNLLYGPTLRSVHNYRKNHSILILVGIIINSWCEDSYTLMFKYPHRLLHEARYAKELDSLSPMPSLF